MLETIGVRSMDDLLVDIPQSLRLDGLQLPDGLSELETMAQVSALAGRNRVYPDRLTFRGGGVYRRFFPAAAGGVGAEPGVFSPPTPHPTGAGPGPPATVFENHS